MTYEIWETEPALNRGVDWDIQKAGGFPFDEDWERWSYPIGNGAMGMNLFGRTDTERLQLSDKGLHNGSRKRDKGMGSFTNFAEIMLEFGHREVDDYRRSLNLNDAMARVSYRAQGVQFEREMFASCPDNVMVVRLTADRKSTLSFTVRPEVPYLDQSGERSADLTVQGDLLTFAGTDNFFHCNYEGQIRVLHEGGTLIPDPEENTLTLKNADSATLLIATGTNYRLCEEVFLREPDQKLDHELFPHADVSSRIEAAAAMEYETLRQRHLNDYRNLFDRVSFRLTPEPSRLPTSEVLYAYRKGVCDVWLEELLFHYGRYLLIASSREKSLPANLQGTWTQYYASPWTSGYWHNINVQMNYWGVMSANLAECFEGYTALFQAFLPKARKLATEYVRRNAPDRLSTDPGGNGWILGTAANPYYISGPGGHSGPGTGGFTSKLFMEAYLYSRDETYLREVAYPILRSLSVFYLKALREHGDLLLVEPSASPEQMATEEQIAHMPGSLTRPEKGHYVTVGCTFDQGFVWENFNDTLILAEELGEQDSFLDELRGAMKRLDPIQVGASGQIKEYREEDNYSDIGQPQHRHISHLCPLYPGTLISSAQEEWMEAARITLDLRGDKATGWAMAHRMNCRARLKEGEKAHRVFRSFIQKRVVENLWTLHPPFQIDGNLGTMAGTVEMLLQSHQGYIEILPALPGAWASGSFSGLVARGNVEVSAEWSEGRVTDITLVSRKGGTCRLACPHDGRPIIRSETKGLIDNPVWDEEGILTLPTSAEETLHIRFEH
jgi:alpha-L-fucosidase 2